MAIINVAELDEGSLNIHEKEYLKEARRDILNIAKIYGQASSMFSASTDRTTFMDFIFEECKKTFKWNPAKLENIDEMKKRLFVSIMSTSKDPDTGRPRGIIPCIASFTAPKNRANHETQMSDLEMIAHKVEQDTNLVRALQQPGEVRDKALAKLAENPNRRNTPEVDLTMKINARKIQLKDLVDQYRSYQDLVVASGVKQGTFFSPKSASKNETVRTAKMFDDFLGQGAQEDLNSLVDIEDLQ